MTQAWNGEDRRRKISPEEARFRRGLYVMLVTLGLLAAGGIIYGKQTRNEAENAKEQARKNAETSERIDERNAQLVLELAKLVRVFQTFQRSQNMSEAEAQKERQQLLARIRVLESFILQLLADGSDEENARRFREIQRELKEADDLPNQPKPRPTPKPTPSPTPTCIQINVRVCLYPNRLVESSRETEKDSAAVGTASYTPDSYQ